MLLEDWSTQNPQIRHLIQVLTDSELYAAADYLSVDVLKGKYHVPWFAVYCIFIITKMAEYFLDKPNKAAYFNRYLSLKLSITLGEFCRAIIVFSFYIKKYVWFQIILFNTNNSHSYILFSISSN